jgi:hypothetical protein
MWPEQTTFTENELCREHSPKIILRTTDVAESPKSIENEPCREHSLSAVYGRIRYPQAPRLGFEKRGPLQPLSICVATTTTGR